MKIIDILENDKWINDFAFFNEFEKSSYYEILLDTYKNLNTDILFNSKIHGQSHIERVILISIILSWKYDLDKKDTDILRYAASLHDTKRVDDSYDTEHGHRAALESIDYAYGLSYEDKEILKAVMTSHSRSDKIMDLSIKEFDIKDFDRAYRLSRLFKDSDNLDRVRLGDLNTKFLRNDFSLELVDFAQSLFLAYFR